MTIPEQMINHLIKYRTYGEISQMKVIDAFNVNTKCKEDDDELQSKVTQYMFYNDLRGDDYLFRSTYGNCKHMCERNLRKIFK